MNLCAYACDHFSSASWFPLYFFLLCCLSPSFCSQFYAHHRLEILGVEKLQTSKEGKYLLKKAKITRRHCLQSVRSVILATLLVCKLITLLCTHRMHTFFYVLTCFRVLFGRIKSSSPEELIYCMMKIKMVHELYNMSLHVGSWILCFFLLWLFLHFLRHSWSGWGLISYT